MVADQGVQTVPGMKIEPPPGDQDVPEGSRRGRGVRRTRGRDVDAGTPAVAAHARRTREQRGDGETDERVDGGARGDVFERARLL